VGAPAEKGDDEMTTRVPGLPPESIFHLDLKPHRPYLVDLPPLGTVGARREQPGWVYVRAEIVTNQPACGAKAGITDGDFQAFLTLDAQVLSLGALLPVVDKALEVLRESLAYVDGQRHRLVTQFANLAETRADLRPGYAVLLSAYEKCIAYRGAIADKGVKTREQNEADKKAGKAPEPKAPKAKVAQEPIVVSRVPALPPEMVFGIDLSPLRPFLVDLPPGGARGLRRVQDEEAWKAVVQEIVDSHALHADKDGITDADYQRFLALNEQYDRIEAAIPAVEKALEVVEESLVYVDNLRHQYVTQFADSAEQHAKEDGGDPTLLTNYEKTIAYRAVIADKAAKTRRENDAVRKAAEGAKGPTGPTPDKPKGGATGATGP
jgi:hypothetical protein